MHKLMTGEDDSFDKSFYNELVSCSNKYDPELMDVINAQWKGFRSYAASNICYYHTFVEISHHEGWSMPEYAGKSCF